MEFRNIFVYPKYPKNLDKLYKIAYNCWILWDMEAIKLFMSIDSKLFRKCNKNPILFLMLLNDDILNKLSADKGFIYNLEKVWEKLETYTKYSSNSFPQLKGKTIAYFSMEYGIHQALPIYAGGLGILSGDHMKGASDLNFPITGVGLFYQYGYFNQNINVNGIQEEVYNKNNPYFLPLKEIKDANGDKILIKTELLSVPIFIKIWELRVGQNRILLLDTNVEENPPEFRKITDILYVADKEKRIQQEIILGIGGVKALNTLGIHPDVFHLNEGHSVFLIIERLRHLIKDLGLSFEQAFQYIKMTSVFTTHTPVAAGNENVSTDLIRKYLSEDIQSIGVSIEDFLNFGYLNDKHIFWLPALAIRFSSFINGVSHIHEEVSKKMWKSLFTQMHCDEIPIEGITNGVHYSWLSFQLQYLFERYLGPSFYHFGQGSEIWENIEEIPDEEIWDAHQKRKKEMITYIRQRMVKILRDKGFSNIKVEKANKLLNQNYLTIGFARRFATYKRASLILKDKARLKKILLNPERPVQLVFSGKAHPADLAGKNLIKEIIDFAREYDLEDRVIFVEDYDMDVAKHLVQGVDIWLNNPIKPNEASGTSGIKAGINGVLNLSVLDGWWPECYNGENGWAISAGDNISDNEIRDLAESNQLYEYLEDEISGIYYDRNDNDIPENWVKKMKNSIYSVFKNFNINRMLEEYAGKFYIPAIQNSLVLKKDNFAKIKEIDSNFHHIAEFWEKIYIKEFYSDFDHISVIKSDDQVHCECYVYLDGINRELIDIEFFYYLEKDRDIEYIPLQLSESYPDKVAKFEGKIRLKSSGIQKFNVRIVPKDPFIKVIYPFLMKWYY